MNTEEKIYGLLETADQQQKNLAIAEAALEATRKTLDELVEKIQAAATQAASAAADKGAAALMAGAAAPAIRRLKEVAASAAGVEARFRRAAAWVSWRVLSIVAVGCASLVLAMWIAVTWQRHELTQMRDQKAALEGQIATMQTTVAELAQLGGKIQFRMCGDQRRKCVKVDQTAGTFGQTDQGEYMILDGY